MTAIRLAANQGKLLRIVLSLEANLKWTNILYTALCCCLGPVELQTEYKEST